nr:Chain E, ONCOPROTEIN4YOZ_B Chain B, HPV E7 peptide [Human papillomavirus]
DLYCYEQLN